MIKGLFGPCRMEPQDPCVIKIFRFGVQPDHPIHGTCGRSGLIQDHVGVGKGEQPFYLRGGPFGQLFQ